jgi:hypothetical protein
MRITTIVARSSVLALTLALSVMTLPQPAAAHHVIGVTITPTNVDSVAHSANITVTESTTGISGTIHVGAGVAWGDAVTSFHNWTMTTVGPPNVYRVALSHTYPDLSTRTITAVGDCCNASFITPTATHKIDFGCSDTPMGGCHAAGASKIDYKNNLTDDTKDKLSWKWSKGDLTPAVDLGNPTTSTQYFVCLYAPTPIFRAVVPSGANWRIASAGAAFKYKDKTGAAGGITAITVKSGGSGKSQVQVKGAGLNLEDPAMPLTQPVLVQLQNSAGKCWEHAFTSPELTNTIVEFSDKEP